MNYLWYSAKIFLAVICMAVFSYPAQSAKTELKTDYTRLAALIKIEDKRLPLYAFQDFENDFDEESHRALLDHFNNQPDLIQGIKTQLGEKSLRW